MAKKLPDPNFTKFPELTEKEMAAMDEATFTARIVEMRNESRGRRADGTQLLYEAAQLDQTIDQLLMRRVIVARQQERDNG